MTDTTSDDETPGDDDRTSERERIEAFAAESGWPIVRLSELSIPPELIELVPPAVARTMRALAVAEDDEVVTVAVDKPGSTERPILAELSSLLKRKLQGALAFPGELDAAILKHYGDSPAAGEERQVLDSLRRTPARPDPEETEEARVGSAASSREDRIEMELIDEEELEEAEIYGDENNLTTFEALVQMGLVTDEDVLFALGRQTGMEVVDVESEEIRPEVIDLVPKTLAFAHRVIPIAEEDGIVIVALSDPMNTVVLDELRFMLNKEVKGAIAMEESIDAAIERYYGSQDDQSMEDALNDMGIDVDSLAHASHAEASGLPPLQFTPGPDGAAIDEASEAAALLDATLAFVFEFEESWLELSLFQGDFVILTHFDDGSESRTDHFGLELGRGLIDSIKSLAGIPAGQAFDPDTTLRGRFTARAGERELQVDVSSRRTTTEGATLTLHTREPVKLDRELGGLGLSIKEQRAVERALSTSSGLILVTGPQRSGKTTTLYAALRRLIDGKTKTVTVEGPVELDIDGATQCPINREIGFTFGRGLKAALHHEPDNLLVGELHDRETAGMAVDAAGTLRVLTALRVSGAVSAIHTLIDLGVSPMAVAKVLTIVVAQARVRPLCPDCRVEQPRDQLSDEARAVADDQLDGITLFKPGSCERCVIGYGPSKVLFEVLEPDQTLREAIATGAGPGELRELAATAGLMTLREAALAEVRAGRLSIDEVLNRTRDTS